MLAEAPRFEPKPGQPGPDALANLFDNPERRNALIDEVVFSSATQPQPGFETPVFEQFADRHEKASIDRLRLELLKAQGERYELIDGNGANPFFRAQPVFEPVISDTTTQTQISFKDRLKSKVTTLKDTIIHSTPAKIARRAALAAAVSLGSSAPALANGFKIEPGGTNTTAECSDDPNIMTVNREYADKIARGEVIIANKGVLAAAGYEGDKTAIVEPISPDEAYSNLLLPAPACPVTEPTPTPEITPRPSPTPEIKKTIEDFLTENHPNVEKATVLAKIKDVYKNTPYLQDMIDGLNICAKKRNPGYCTNNVVYALQDFQRSKDAKYWDMALMFYNFGIHNGTTKNRQEEYTLSLNEDLRSKFPDSIAALRAA